MWKILNALFILEIALPILHQIVCCHKKFFLCSQIPLPINISSSDVNIFFKTHDLAITKQQKESIMKIVKSSMLFHTYRRKFINFNEIVAGAAKHEERMVQRAAAVSKPTKLKPFHRVCVHYPKYM